MKLLALAATAALSVGAAATTAQAGPEAFDFTGSTSKGAFTATAVLDVENGFAVSGSGTISGDDLGFQSFTLVTAQTPGAEIAQDGTFGFRSNGGDDLGGADDAVPVGNGLLFALGPASPTFNGNLLFGVYDSGGGSYADALYGYSANGTRFYEQGGATTISVSAVSAAPEPGLWALMLGGVGILGGVLRMMQVGRRQDRNGVLTA